MVEAGEVYSPREDSFLMCEVLKKHLDKIDGKKVMDVGTGSGIVALEVSENAKLVVAGDVSKSAIRYAKKKFTSEKLKNAAVVVCDLMSCLKDIDVVIFNPTYLPRDDGDQHHDITVDGGNEGCEVIIRFLREFKNSDAKMAFLLFSSLSNPEKIIDSMRKLKINFEKVAHKKMFFEELYVYLLKK
jgi:HemK-related putative methylase